MKKLLSVILLSGILTITQAAGIRLLWNPSPSSDQTLGYWVYVANGTNEISDSIKTNATAGAYRFTVPTNAFFYETNTGVIKTNITATVTNLPAGVYKFRVTATNVWDESQMSLQVATPPGAPSAPVIGDITVVIP